MRRRRTGARRGPPWRADWVVISLVGVLGVASGALMIAYGLLWDLSINFDCAPWRAAQEDALAAAYAGGCGGDPQAGLELTCPFYNNEPAEAQCPACGTVVSRSGLHEARAGAAAQQRRACAALPRPLTARAARRGAAQEKVLGLGEFVLDWGRAMQARGGRQPRAAPRKSARVVSRKAMLTPRRRRLWSARTTCSWRAATWTRRWTSRATTRCAKSPSAA
jgi:hypothetical protein